MSGVIDLGSNVTMAGGVNGAPIGTVTLVNTGSGLTGGPITSTGTVSVASISLTTQTTGILPVTRGGTGTSSAFTSGSMIYVSGPNGIYSSTNSVSFDNVNIRIGIGTNSPLQPLDVNGNINIRTGGILNFNNQRALWFPLSRSTMIGVTSGNTVASQTGDYNTGIGYSALSTIMSGQQNTAVGYNALGAVTTATACVAVGVNTLANNISGGSQTAVGTNALTNATGANNSAFGSSAGASLYTGATNTFIGFNADMAVAASSSAVNNCTVIGYNAVGTKSNQMVIGGPAVTEVLLQYGNVGIGTTPATQLHTTGTVRFANFGVGTATFDASGNLSSISDENMKNVQRDYSDGLEQIKLINPVVYKWNEKSGFETEHEYIGWTAQNLKEALSGAVYSKKMWADDNGKILRAVSLGDPQDGPKDLKVNPETPDQQKIITQKDLFSVNDRAVLAAIVNALKSIDARLTALENS